MQTIVLLACLALLLWVEPASAQKEYSLTVSIHQAVQPRLTEKVVEGILKRASKLLQKDPGHLDRPNNVKCNVTFKLDGPVRTFALPSTPKAIQNEDQLEAVHRESADVKIVESINFCKKYSSKGFIGCSWRRDGPKTMIVTPSLGIAHILWAHEFGHTAGLQHRVDDPAALMTPCDLFYDSVKINDDECGCFVGGPGYCSIPDTDLVCTETR